jgi:hypothetical protein
MPTYLKHVPSGDVYPFNADMFRRGDMEPCNLDGTPIIDAPAEPELAQAPVPEIPVAPVAPAPPRRGRPPKAREIASVDPVLLGDDNEFAVT